MHPPPRVEHRKLIRIVAKIVAFRYKRFSRRSPGLGDVPPTIREYSCCTSDEAVGFQPGGNSGTRLSSTSGLFVRMPTRNP